MSKRFNYPLCFEPVFMHRIWGGRRLETMLGKLLPQSGLFGESWEISDQGEATSFVAGGPLQGVSLRELMREAPAELLGSAVVDRARQIEFGTLQFPLLVKWIDAREKLSLQVHPPDWYRMLRTGERAKSECWFVVEA